MIVGTTGHIDHGKTALVGRLTGIDTDRLKEEKARGISIDLGFAYWPRPGGEVVGFVDVPGHEGLVHNMLAGATGIDFVLLVIAADDGIMPQTREHLAIIDLLGLDRGIVAINKSDLVDDDRIAALNFEITALLEGTSLEGAEILPVSAVTGEGVERLAAKLDEASKLKSRKPGDGLFRLAVDRVFTLTGQGTTVTGTVLSGRVAVGDRVAISPAGIEARVRSIHAQNRRSEAGEAGQRCALVLAGPQVSKDTIARGEVVLDPALHAPTRRIDAKLRVLAGEPKPIGQWFPVKVHHAAAETPGRIVLLADPIAPGASGYVQLVLEKPLAAASGDRFIIRDTSSSRTVGGGSFIDLRPPERKRRTPERLARIEALSEREPSLALTRILEEGNGWIELEAFFRDRTIGQAAANSIVSNLPLVTVLERGREIALSRRLFETIERQIVENLQLFHAKSPDLPGIGLEQLRQAVQPPIPAPLFIAIVKKAAEEGVCALDRTWVRHPSHQVRFSEEEERCLASIKRRLLAEPYRPPRVRDIAKAMIADEGSIRRLLRMAARRGEVEEIAHDHFFLRSVVEGMARIVIELSEQSPDGRFTAAQFRDRLDNGRKVAIQILEFFDRHGFTIRRQDLRRVNSARIEFFVPRGTPSHGGVPLPVGRPDFKSGWDRQTVSGGFDSHPPPPALKEVTQ